MKQQIFIILYCTVMLIVAGTTASRCHAQEPETAWIEMMPAIPPELTEPSQRAEYLVTRFWDKFNFRDTTLLLTHQLLERCFVEYVDLLSLVPEDTRDQSIQSLLKKSEEVSSMFAHILQLSEKYLYEPASPLCDEEKLIPFLQYALRSPQLDDYQKISLQYRLDCISINRTGSIANDFTYTLIDGETGRLHAIRADYTLLYFNDPECDDCQMLIKQLTVSPTINQHILAGLLKIITVYVNDDLDAWKKHARDVLSTWIYAYDAEQKIHDETIYNIKQFPTLYLLDPDKKVILKDINFETLEAYFKTP